MSTKFWMTTFTGRELDPLRITEDQVDIRDIAHHLACVNRFCGALRAPVSVAQHSVYVARLSGPRREDMLQGLLHDASEAYLGDVVKPLKEQSCFREYLEHEEVLQAIILTKFGCHHVLADVVGQADRRMCRYEAHHSGITFRNPDWPPPTPEETKRVGRWHPWAWWEAENRFLRSFAELSQV